MLSRGAGTHRERLPAWPGTAPAGISVERKPRAQLEVSLEGHLEGDSSSEDEELEPGSEDESFEEEPEVFPRSPSPGTPTPPKALAAPAEAVPPVPPPPADAGNLELRHEAATVNLAEAPSASVQAGHSEDDEFDYAFTGAAREAPGHVETFKAAPLPAHLVSDTKGLLREEALLEEGDEEEESESEDDEEWAKNVVSGKGSKLEKLIIVDHSKIDYMKFRKNFFIESPEIAKMTPQDVAAYRKELDNIKVRGKNIPKPIKDWHQCGLSTRVLQVIKLLKFDKPMPIQSQALPVIM